MDTFERVMPRCRASKTMVGATSVAQRTMQDVLQPSTAPTAPPRGAATAAAIAAAAEDHVQSLFVVRPAPPERATETAERFAAPPPDALLIAQGLAASRAGARSPNALRPGALAASVGATAQPAAYGGHYASEAPVTASAARASELVFPFGASGRPPPPGLPAFTLAVHGEGAAVLPDGVRGPGAELSLAPLLARLEKRLAGAGVAGGARGLWTAVEAAVAAGGVVARAEALAGGSGVLPGAPPPPPAPPLLGEGGGLARADVFRLAVHSLRCGLSDPDLEALVRACAPRPAAAAAALTLRGWDRADPPAAGAGRRAPAEAVPYVSKAVLDQLLKALLPQ